MRWGTNVINSGATLVDNNSTVGFTTLFERQGLAFEAQAATGDSGGAVFHFDNQGNWSLVGIMLAQRLLANQPANTIVFGDQTESASLASYRAQIVDWVANADTMWQNQANHTDVNRSTAVTPLDALLVINEVQLRGTHGFAAKPSATSPLYDVSGDGQVSTLDALQVINQLIGQLAAAPAASPASALAVPEPSTGVLIALGMALLGLARFLAAWRRGR
jgi:hypothetical protein